MVNIYTLQNNQPTGAPFCSALPCPLPTQTLVLCPHKPTTQSHVITRTYHICEKRWFHRSASLNESNPRQSWPMFTLVKESNPRQSWHMFTLRLGFVPMAMFAELAQNGEPFWNRTDWGLQISHYNPKKTSRLSNLLILTTQWQFRRYRGLSLTDFIYLFTVVEKKGG